MARKISIALSAQFIVALIASFGIAILAVTYIEQRLRNTVEGALRGAGHDWVEIRTNGLRVELSGRAESETRYLSAVSIVEAVTSAARINDRIEVIQTVELEPPEFLVGIANIGDQIHLFGEFPNADIRKATVSATRTAFPDLELRDFTGSSNRPAANSIASALDFGIDTLRFAPEALVLVSEAGVHVAATARSFAHSEEIETALRARLPPDVALFLNLTAPREVVSPYTFDLTIDGEDAVLGKCHAETEEGRRRIIRAASESERFSGDCRVAIGAPSRNWVDAVVSSIEALRKLGGGRLTANDREIRIEASTPIPDIDFERITGELAEATFGDFSLHAVPALVGNHAIRAPKHFEFLATRKLSGHTELRGSIPSSIMQLVVVSYAKAAFGVDKLRDYTILESDLPQDWVDNVLPGLEALSMIEQGSLHITRDHVVLTGVSHLIFANDKAAEYLADNLRDRTYDVDIRFEAALLNSNKLTEPAACIAQVNDVLATSRISFEPGSSDLKVSALPAIGNIATILNSCGHVPMEVGGYTDSQGREAMNLRLSEIRAQAVVTALLAEQAPTRNLTAKGYGEADPIADNSTEEGRERNRRIEFKLIVRDFSVGPQ